MHGNLTLLCSYYFACLEPDLTIDTTAHIDPSFLTIFLQDNISGLQVHHQNQWIDVLYIGCSYGKYKGLYAGKILFLDVDLHTYPLCTFFIIVFIFIGPITYMVFNKC